MENEPKSTEKRFQCDICSRLYATPVTLKVHRMQHKAGKTELCDCCGASFKTRGQLKIHRRVHTGEKPYKCNTCGKTFPYRESLITHSTTHTRMKQFVCIVCNAQFSCIGNLLKHRKVRANQCGLESVPIKRIGPRLNKKTLPNLTDKGPKEYISEERSSSETIDPAETELLEHTRLNDEQQEEAKSFSENTITQKCIRLSVETLEPNVMIQEGFRSYESSAESDEDIPAYEEIVLNEEDESIQVATDVQEDGTSEESNQLVEIVETTGERAHTSVYLISYRDELETVTSDSSEYEINKLDNSADKDNESEHSSNSNKYESSEAPNKAQKETPNQETSSQTLEVNFEQPDEETAKRTKELLDKQLSRLHELSDFIDGRYRCKLCPQQYTTLYRMARHLERVHNVQQDRAREKLQYVRNITRKEIKYRCKYCDQTYVNMACLTKHLAKHGQDGRLKHKCPCCDQYFETNDEITQHTLEQHRERVECGICQTRYTKPDSLKRHIRYAHTTKSCSKYICSQCGQSFQSVTMLSDHERAKCGTEPIYQCTRCEKHYSSYSSLKMHQTVHDNVLPYECSFCGKKFRTKGQLKVHERGHTGERPFRCEICLRSFPYRESLQTHRTIHTGVTRHECTECDKKFSCFGNLKKHRQIYHSEIGGTVGRRKTNSENRR